MARKKLLHLRSSVVEGQGVNSAPKLPTPEQIEIGEIAINFAKGYETLSIKNASGEVVTFTNDEYWVEKERVVAAALNDLDERKGDASAVTSVETIVTAHTANTTIHVTAEDKEKLDNALSGVSVNAVPLTVSDSIVDIPSATTTDFGVVKMDTELDSGSTNAVMNSAITTVILSNERVTAAALNDLEERKLDASAIAPLTAHTANTTIHVTSEDKTKWNNSLSGVTVNDTPLTPSARVVTIPSATTSVFGVVKVDTTLDTGSTNPIANSAVNTAISGLDSSKISAGRYDSQSKYIYFYSGTTADTDALIAINATDFIKDGMVDSVTIDDVVSGSSTVKCLVVTFNTDAGKEDINIPLSDIFDPDLYYDKTYIDNNTIKDAILSGTAISILDANRKLVVDTELDTGSTNPIANSAITKIIYDDEKVTSAALNDLETRKADASAVTSVESIVTAHTANTTIHVTAEDKTKINSALSGVSINGSALTVSDNIVNILSATTTDFGVVKVDAALDSGSTNPVANSAITKIIDDKELVIAAAFNDLNNRKADASGITSITSSIDEINNNYVSAVTVNGGAKIIGKNINIPAATVSTYGVVVLDTTLDTGSTNPVANSAIAAALDGKLSGVAVMRGTSWHNVSVENGVARIPVADSQSFGVVTVDNVLSTGSKNPVANSAITAAIVSGVSLNGGTTIAPRHGIVDIPMATSGTAGVTIVKNDLETNSGSTDAISCKAVYDVIVDNEIVMAGALNDLNNRIAELEARIAALENPTP